MPKPAFVLPVCLFECLPSDFASQPFLLAWFDLRTDNYPAVATPYTAQLHFTLDPVYCHTNLPSIWQGLEQAHQLLSTQPDLPPLLILCGRLPDATNTPDCWALDRVQHLLRDLQAQGERVWCLDVKTEPPQLLALEPLTGQQR